jgi:excisionase family DNA binding protein
MLDEVRCIRESVENLCVSELNGPLSYDKAAKRLGISSRGLSKLVANGEVKSTRIGGRVVFMVAKLDEYLEAQTGIGAEEIERRLVS